MITDPSEAVEAVIGAMAGRPAPSARTCPECRDSMRRWSLQWRQTNDPRLRGICLTIAQDWRDGTCIHAGLRDALAARKEKP